MANAKNMQNKPMNVLLYGPPGTGKTSLAATFPNPHVLDFDNGMLTVQGSDVEYITINNRETKDPDFIELFGEKKAKLSAFEKGQLMLEHWANTLGPDDTLVMDSLTRFNNYTMDRVLKLAAQSFPRIQDWGTGQKMIERSLEALTDVDCNLIIIAHESFVKDEESGIVSWMPDTIGKLAGRVGVYFDEVWRAQAEKGKGAQKDEHIYWIETKPQRRTTAKSRLKLPFRVENPTHESILKAVGTQKEGGTK